MKKTTTIEICNQELSFSIAHFTTFSATKRERLHGHNYFVHVCFTAEIQDFGLAFDYEKGKEKLYKLCRSLHSYMVLTKHSPYLTMTEDDIYYQVVFDQDKMFFLKKDTLILPIRNVTIEEMAQWFVDQLSLDTQFIADCHIKEIYVKISNGPGQWADAVSKKF